MPQKFYINKFTVYKTDKKEHNIKKCIAVICLVKIAHNLIILIIKQIGIPSSTLSKICKKAVEYTKKMIFLSLIPLITKTILD